MANGNERSQPAQLTTDAKLVPQNAVWRVRMTELVREIENAHSQDNWYIVEIRARELAIMCEMRRTK